MGALLATLRSDFWPATIDYKAYKSVYGSTVIVANATDGDVLVKVTLERRTEAPFAALHERSYLCFWPWTARDGACTKKKGATVYVSIRFPDGDRLPVDDLAVFSHHVVLIDRDGRVIQKKSVNRDWNVWLNDGPVWVDDRGVNHRTW